MHTRHALPVLALVSILGCGDEKPQEPMPVDKPQASTSSASAATPRPAVSHVDPNEAAKGSVEKFATLGGEPAFDAIAIDAKNVYAIIAEGREEVLVKVPLAGGKPEKVGTIGALGNANLRVSDKNAYWTDRTSYSTMPLAGGTPSRRSLDIEGFQLDGGDLYACAKGKVVVVKEGSAAISDFATYTAGRGCVVALDKSDVYWNYSAGDPKAASGVIMRAAKDGKTPAATVTEQRSLGSFAFDEENVYWSRAGTIDPTDDEQKDPIFEKKSVKVDGSIMRVAKKGGEPVTLAKGELSPRSVLVDDKWIFWDSAIGIRRMAKTGGTPDLLVTVAAEDRYWRSSIVMSKTHLYWATMAGDLMRVAKEK